MKVGNQPNLANTKRRENSYNWVYSSTRSSHVTQTLTLLVPDLSLSASCKQRCHWHIRSRGNWHDSHPTPWLIPTVKHFRGHGSNFLKKKEGKMRDNWGWRWKVRRELLEANERKAEERRMFSAVPLVTRERWGGWLSWQLDWAVNGRRCPSLRPEQRSCRHNCWQDEANMLLSREALTIH